MFQTNINKISLRFALGALVVMLLMPMVWLVKVPQAEAVTYQHAVIAGCDVEYFILGPDDKRLAANATLDRTKQYTVRLSINIVKSNNECINAEFYETGYILTENATDKDKQNDASSIKGGKVTAKYTDACFKYGQFRMGENNTKYVDTVVNDAASDTELWRYFQILSGDSTFTSDKYCKVGDRSVYDKSGTAVFVKTTWAGAPANDKNDNTLKGEIGGTPNGLIDTNTGANFNTNYDANLGTFFNPIDAESVPQLITRIIRILFILTGLIAVIVIIIAGFRMVIDSGNETQLKKAKAAITWAIIGLIVSILAFSIVAIIQRIIQS
jgi:hypothetical protein